MRAPSYLNLFVTFSLLALVVLMLAGTKSDAASSAPQARASEATSSLGRTLAEEFRKCRKR